MAEEIASIVLGPVIQEAVQWVAKPIARQFKYLCCFSSNISSLEVEAKKLDDKTGGLQMRVDAAKNNTRDIDPEVKTWLIDSAGIKVETDRIVFEARNVQSGCMNIKKRFSLSKEAVKKTIAMKELLEQCRFGDDISHPPPIAAAAPVPSGTIFHVFESRREIEEGIMTTLKGKKVNMTGICGMGGVGKTTMAKNISNRALKEGLFDEVVMVVVSQPVDELNIQLQIAESLRLELEEETLIPRAHKLHMRLSQKKKTLIILDDVWESLNLGELGIPCEDDGCIILLTSRNRDVLRAMNVENVCGLEMLKEEESWFLFKEKAGTCVVDDDKLNPIAQKVMRECKDLPLALATVGMALKDENDIHIWNNALQQMSRANPEDIPNVIKDVYNPLRVSYDRLDSKNAQSTFLLCCLFGEDKNIPVEHLTYFAMGLHLFEDVWELEEVRNTIRASIKKLKSRCLLLDGSDEDHVRMHDIVRDVSIFIASKEGHVKRSDCTWISTFVDGRARVSPKLNLLFIDNRAEQKIQITSTIAGSEELNVLFVRHDRVLKSLPQLKSLKTLVLYDCESLESISVVGQFESLEILICHGCDCLKELPEQVRELKRLRLLEISYCHSLKVAAGVISNLDGLEELKIVKSFSNWEGAAEVEAEVEAEIEEGKERKNANSGLRELESLMNLRCLEIQVLDVALAAQPLKLSDKLEKFDVRFGADHPTKYQFASYRISKKNCYQRKMSLDLPPTEYRFADTFLTRTEYLSANGHGANIDFNLERAQNIRCLKLCGFGNMKNVTIAAAVLPLLEDLWLEKLDKLEEIWDGPIPSNCFNNLKQLTLHSLPALKQLGKSGSTVVPNFTNLSSLKIQHCKRLHNVFSSSTATATNNCLSQLETIEIEDCDEMEQLALGGNEEDEGNDVGQQSRITLIFPKLKSLKLERLKKLTSICKGIDSIQFPVLADIWIRDCKSMKCFIVSSSDDDEQEHHYGDNDSLHLFCPPKVSFGNLSSLEIDSCHRLRNVFSSATAAATNNCLPQLESIVIEDCDEMEQLVLVENEEDGGNVVGQQSRITLIFPKLKSLSLCSLKKLTSICKGIDSIQFPVLDDISISDCESMKCFVVSSSDDDEKEHHYGENDSLHLFCDRKVSFGNLSSLEIDSCHRLRNVFSPATAAATNNCLSQLESIAIGDCDEMEQLALGGNEEDEGNDVGQQSRITLIFPKLKSLKLMSLKKLTSICKGIDSIQFPVLADIWIRDCKSMKCFIVSSSDDDEQEHHYGDNDSLHLFCPPKVSFGNLKKLYMWTNESNRLWCDQVPISFFNGLQQLDISNYSKIRSLFSSSIAQNLVNLQKLSIYECGEMVKVIEEDKEEEKDDVCSDDHHLSTTKHTTLFPKLEFLHLNALPAIKQLGKSSSPIVPLFTNLSSLKISFLKRLRNVFSSATKDYLLQLESIEIEDCDEMEQLALVGNEEDGGNDVGQQSRITLIFPKLKSLKLERLKKLTSICKGIDSIQFPVLADISITNCESMKCFVVSSSDDGEKEHHYGDNDSLHLFCQPKVSFGNLSSLYIDSCHRLRNVFSSATAAATNNCLSQLESIVIEDCDEMEQLVLVENEEDGGNVVGQQSRITLIFPKLKSLSLCSLKKLTSICKGIDSIQFPVLAYISITNCESMKCFVVSSSDDDEKEHHYGDNDSLHLFCDRKVSFGNLSSLEIDSCHRLRNVFSPATAAATNNCLSQLESIAIGDCDEMEQLALGGNEEDEGNDVGQQSRITLIFPKLKSLKLMSLKKLTSICKGIDSIQFPVLADIWIRDCKSMKCFIVSSSDDDEQEHHYGDNDSLHLFCPPKVSFGNLKELYLWTNESNRVWCDQVPVSFFNGLQQLDISYYSKIRSLFSSSIAQNLVNLQKLSIYECGEMVKVIEEDKEEEKDEVCSTTKHTTLFPKLEYLNLSYLSELESFCEWRSCAPLELPSLDTVWIDECPEMKSFIRGGSLIITPELENIFINGEDLESGVKDLNAAVHQHFEDSKEKQKEEEQNS